MTIKNIKTIFNFFLKRKLSTILSLLLYSITASLDSIIIFLSEYEIRQILENFSITKISKILLVTIGLKLFFQIFIINNNQFQFGSIFINSLKKFFSSLSQNKAIFGQTQVLSNILKFQWEIKFISNETNRYCIKILTNISYFFVFFISICKIFLIDRNEYLVISFALSLFFMIAICILDSIHLRIESNNFQLTEKCLSEVDIDIIRFIENEEIQNNSRKYQLFINQKLKVIKSLLMKIFIQKSFVEFLIFIVRFIGVLSIFYTVSFSLQQNQYSVYLSFIIYNVLMIFFGFKIYKNINDKNILALISQHSISLIRNDEENQSYIENSISNSGNDIIIESVEFQDVNLEPEQGLSIQNINFFAKIKDNIAFLSSQDNISLIKTFLQNYKIKTSGKIMINSHEIESINKENLLSLVTIISNEIIISNDTIKNNIGLQNAQLSDEIIVKACKLSYLYNFIASLPLGFYTILNNSIILTEIEKFQISLTRALLGDAHIIVVDFTQIDENHPTIHSIKEMLFSSLVDRILIVLTKNTFGIKDMSQIIFYEHESTICHGSHDDLLKNNKKYSDFYLKNYSNVEFSE